MPRARTPTSAASSAPGHSDRGHARFSPSASDRWMECPASVPFTELLVQTGTIPDPSLDRSGHAANRGTLAHELGEHWLRTGSSTTHPPAIEGQQADRTWAHRFNAMSTADQAFIERHAKAYFDYVTNLKTSLADFATVPEAIHLQLETRVDLTREVWGSIDAAIILGRELWVIDLKTGHRAVPAERNLQLMTYAAGIAKRMGWEIDVAHLIIVQPEVESEPLVWDASLQALKMHYRRCGMSVAKAEAWNPLDPLVGMASGDHCTYCPAKAHCPAQRAVATSVFGEVAAAPAALNLRPVGSLTPEQRAFILTHEKAMREWLDAIRDDAITNRNPPPGFKIVAANGRTRWRDDDQAMQFLQAHAPSLIRQTLPTITEARRALTSEQFANLTDCPQGAPTLAPESDPRPALPAPGDVFNTP